MDDLDHALLAALRADARAPVSSLARRLGIARTTVQARIERLERMNVIAGYTIRPGDGLDAPLIRATVLLQLEPRSAPVVLQRLRAMEQVRLANTTSGRFDLVLEIATRSTSELDRVLDEIGAAKGVLSSESLIHLSTRIDRR